jgi:CRISPR system Cascade subunit CasE
VPLRKEESRLGWLTRKAATAGFELVEVQGVDVVDAMQREPNVVRGRREGGVVTIEGVLFEGRLRVVDAQAFRAALVEGIGRGRAYGFGLLSVAPL